MYCNCTTSIDIRGRCLPNRNRKEWRNCRVKIETTYWLIFNDYDIYKSIDKCGFESDIVKNKVKENHNITDKDWLEVVKMYNEDSDRE